MVEIMESPNLSDSGRPESPATSSNPGSPLNNNNNSNTPNQESKYQKSEHSLSPTSFKISRNLEASSGAEEVFKDVKPKFSVLSSVNKDISTTQLITHHRNSLDQILYPKPGDRDALEPNAKFSIERLKQLADQRLSPSNIENNALSNNKIYSIDHTSGKFQNSSSLIAATVASSLPLTTELLGSHQQQQQSAFNQLNQHQHHMNILTHGNHFKYGLMPSVVGGFATLQNSTNNSNNSSTSPSALDFERIKLARTLSNGKELSDFGFRIQLGGLSTNYSTSETHSDSEELNVDGNEDSSQDGNSVSWALKRALINVLI